LSKKKKKILIICPYPEGVAPGQRLKYEQYFDSWRYSGYELTVSPFISLTFWKFVYQKGHLFQKLIWTIWGYLRRIYDVIRAPFFDGIYICLWATPFGPPVFERLLLLSNRKMIYDIDDMIFLGHSSEANKKIKGLKGRSKMTYLMKRAKHVICCTPKLEEFVLQYNLNTTDISSTINTDDYQPKLNYEKKETITLGWSGSHSTSKYLHLLDEVLQELSNLYPIKLRVIGDASFMVDGVQLEAIDWSRESEVNELSKIDIGLYPLPDEPWVYGKSGLKALQYMALGIPTVASDIGANKRVIEHKVDGFLVQTHKDWITIISNLIEDVNLQESIGREARKKVEQEFSVKVNEQKYLDILNNNF